MYKRAISFSLAALLNISPALAQEEPQQFGSSVCACPDQGNINISEQLINNYRFNFVQRDLTCDGIWDSGEYYSLITINNAQGSYLAMATDPSVVWIDLTRDGQVQESEKFVSTTTPFNPYTAPPPTATPTSEEEAEKEDIQAI